MIKPERIPDLGTFTQLEHRMQTQPDAGLGLAIARRLTELHGGHLTIDSEPGMGTAIKMDLPKTG